MELSNQYLITPGAETAIAVGSAKDISLDAAIGTWRTLFGSDASESKPSRPYKQVDLVFNCVSKLIEAVVGMPLVLSTLDDKVVESGPAWDLLFNSPVMSLQKFITATVGHWALSRDVFWVFPGKTPGKPPTEVHVISGTQMHAVTHNSRPNGALIGWEFRPAGGAPIDFSLDEVYQIKNFNPYDPHHGLGPATAARLNIDYIYAATLFNFASLENGADPGVILTTPGRPTPEEVKMLRSSFDARHKGAANAKRTALLTGGTDAKTLAMNMVEMQLAELTNISGARVCSTFGVPPALVGLVTEAQYAHGPAQRDFIFNTILPLCAMLGGEITDGLIARFSPEANQSSRSPGRRKRSYLAARQKAVNNQSKLFAFFDTDQHPTVQEATREIAEKVFAFTQSGVPLNEIIEAHDLPYDIAKIPWGDQWWIPMGQVPASYITEAGPEGLTGPPLPEGEVDDDDNEDQGKDLSHTARELAGLLTEQKSEKADDRQRLRLWKNWVISWAGLEREYNAAIRTFFLRQQRLLTDKLKAACKDHKSISTKADPAEIIARVVFDLRVENGKLKVIHDTFFGRASELGIRQGLTESSGLASDAFESAVDQVKRSSRINYKRTVSSVKLSKVNQTTRARVARQLTEGLGKGESLQQLTDRVANILSPNKLGGRKRALGIARSQTASAVSTGRHESFRHAAVKGKSWITSADDHVRDAHRIAGATYAKPIPLDQPFIVDGEALAYPGDPNGSAKNIANCRCLEIAAALADGKAVTIATYLTMSFYSYSLMQKTLSTKGDK